jgi:non-specific serine/threonine protein kinase/serine/threonine-protein kinase
MELVQGLPITKYCDANRLTIKERLELFVPVCQAIQHAHQKGIIHRDIKPSNVLVATYDGKPTPKVIDFGIAKATGQQLTEDTVFTQFGMVVGTLEYMSPEQATQTSQDIDTRSDIYSLGALLYVLLTGVTPIASSQLRESAYLEMLRKIREDEPLSPSSRLAQSTETLQATSEERKTDPDHLPKLLRGELDWIIMRALEKDRTRRYETANGFARDIQRYLAGEPVEAGPPSATYRLRKFAGKNRVLLLTAAAFAVILLLGAGVSIWQAVRARRAERIANTERDRANTEAASAKAVTDFLEKSLLSQASANQQNGLDEKPDPDIKVRTLLDSAAAGIAGKFNSQPTVEAEIRGTIGNTYRDLNLIPQALAQFQKQYDLDLHALGANDPVTLEALGDIASIDSDQGKLTEATQLKEKVAAGLTRALGAENRRTAIAMQSLGVAYFYQGDYKKAEPLLKKVLAYQMRTVGLDNIETLDTSDSLETLYISDHRYPEAEQLAIPSLAAYKRVFGPNHPYVLRSMYGLGEIDFLQGKYPQAEALFVPVLEANTRIFGPDHPSTLATLGALAEVYGKEGKNAEALATYRQMYDRAKLLGIDLPNTLIEEEELANLYNANGQTAEAEEIFKDSLERMTRVLGPTHPTTLIAIEDYAYFLETHGQFAKAIPLEIRGRDASLKLNGPDHRSTIGFTSTLGKDYLAVHQYPQAEVQLRAALASIQRLQPESWKRYNLESMLGGALMGEHKFVTAEPLVLSGYTGLKNLEPKLPDYTRPYVKDDSERVVQLYQAWGKPDHAAEWRKKIDTKTIAASTPAGH